MKNKPINFLLFFILLICSVSTVKSQSQVFKQLITPSDRQTDDNFGEFLERDGNVLAVASRYQDFDENGQNQLTDAGAVYIFELNSNGVWIQKQKLVASDRGQDDKFGSSIAIYNDLLVIGSGNDFDTSQMNFLINAGSAYIFQKDSLGSWNETQKIVLNNRSAYDGFGASIAIWENDIWVGSPGTDNILGPTNAQFNLGSINLFEFDSLMNKWVQTQIIVPNDPYDTSSFGNSIEIHENLMVVGAYNDPRDSASSNYVNSAGSAYIFKKISQNNWQQVRKLSASDRANGEFFGLDVSIYDSTVVVGCMYDEEDSVGQNGLLASGSAFLYEFESNGYLNLEKKLTASTRWATDFYGRCIDTEPGVIAIGIPGQDYDLNENNQKIGAGALMMFRQNSSGTWIRKEKLIAPNRYAGDRLGWSINLTNNEVLAGAINYERDPNGINQKNDAGAVFYFPLCSTKFKNRNRNICAGDSIKIFGKFYNEAGTYVDTLQATSGCDSIVYTHLTIDTVDVRVVIQNDEIYSLLLGASYQWYDCDSSEIIVGATNRGYKPFRSGHYAVIVEDGNCSDTSLCVEFEKPNSVIQLSSNNSISIFPNPTSGKIEISTNAESIREIKLYTLSGQLLYSEKTSSNDTKSMELDLSEYPSGLYFVECITDEARFTQKVCRR